MNYQSKNPTVHDYFSPAEKDLHPKYQVLGVCMFVMAMAGFFAVSWNSWLGAW